MMKITCDLCGGSLQTTLGGKSAVCTNCGLEHTMERLREKLSIQHQNPPMPDPPKPEPPKAEAIVLEVLSTKKRPGFAWGNAKCFVRQGVVECGMPYYAHINSLEGADIQVGSLQSTDVTAGSEVKMLLYCDKDLLPTIKTLYVFPAGEYDDGDEE